MKDEPDEVEQIRNPPLSKPLQILKQKKEPSIKTPPHKKEKGSPSSNKQTTAA